MDTNQDANTVTKHKSKSKTKRIAKNIYTIKDHDKDTVIFIDKMMIDVETMKQIRLMIENPCTQNIRIMPDVHRGVACCIGFTSFLTDKFLPTFIGSDIGCGIMTYSIDLTVTNEILKDIDTNVQLLIPLGSGLANIHSDRIITNKDLEDLYIMSDESAQEFSKMYEKKFNVDISPFKPNYSHEWLVNRCVTIKADYDKLLRSIGTLGGGIIILK